MENNIEPNPMNQDILAGKWKQMRGDLKTCWGKLTDDDFESIGGAEGQADRFDTREIRIYSRAGRARELSGASKSMATRPAGPLPGYRPGRESSARLPRRRRTRRHPLSVRR